MGKNQKTKASHRHGAGCFSPCIAAAFFAPQCKYPEALMQKFTLPPSLIHSLPPSTPPPPPSQSVPLSVRQPRTLSFSALWMLSVLTFSLAECASSPPRSSSSFLPSLLSLPLLPCQLLSSVSSRSAGLAVTLDFKAPLHSSVTHQLQRKREGWRRKGGGSPALR